MIGTLNSWIVGGKRGLEWVDWGEWLLKIRGMKLVDFRWECIAVGMASAS